MVAFNGTYKLCGVQLTANYIWTYPSSYTTIYNTSAIRLTTLDGRSGCTVYTCGAPLYGRILEDNTTESHSPLLKQLYLQNRHILFSLYWTGVCNMGGIIVRGQYLLSLRL